MKSTESGGQVISNNVRKKETNSTEEMPHAMA
jgi:hypothetical protein